MAKEHSAGAVVYTEAGGRQYLILHYESGHWSFPKGKMERDEQPLDTARREIREETGLEVEFVPGFEHGVNYFFKRGGDTVDKTVDFFLARAKSTGVKLSFEHIGFRWLAYADALKQLTFENDGEALEKAEKFLSQRLPA